MFVIASAGNQGYGFPIADGVVQDETGCTGWEVIVKLSNDLNTTLASTRFGCHQHSGYYHFSAIDDNGDIYITGTTSTGSFPMMPDSFQGVIGGYEDVYVSKVSNDLSALLASTFLGGATGDNARAMAIGPSGDIYVAGSTAGSYPSDTNDFPMTYGSYSPTYNKGGDAFISILDTNLSASDCSFALSANAFTASKWGGTGSVSMTPSYDDCTWTAKTKASWITIQSANSGTGSGTVFFTYEPNTKTSARSAVIVVAGQSFYVSQEGLKQVTLSTTVSGASGMIRTPDNYIVCGYGGTQCSATYNEGMVVTLNASGSDLVQFDGWIGGGCAGQGAVL